MGHLGKLLFLTLSFFLRLLSSSCFCFCIELRSFLLLRACLYPHQVFLSVARYVFPYFVAFPRSITSLGLVSSPLQERMCLHRNTNTSIRTLPYLCLSLLHQPQGSNTPISFFVFRSPWRPFPSIPLPLPLHMIITLKPLMGLYV